MTPRQQKIATVYEQTGSTKKAAKRLKISHQAVQQALVRAQQPRETGPVSYNAYVDKKLPLILTMRDEGMSDAEIARQCGMAPETLRRHLKIRGIERNPEQKIYGAKTRTGWERMYQQKMSTYDIAKKTGVPRSTIDTHLRRRGLLRDKAEATRLALATDPSKRRGGAPKSKQKKAS
jgi:IS30 family transposase